MTKKYILIISSFFLLLLNACGSSSPSDDIETILDPINLHNDNNKAFSEKEKKFVHNLFLNEYLWYDQVASNVDYSTFKTPQDMINTLKVTPPDEWSFAMTKEEYENYVNQKTAGFGFGYTKDFTVYLVRIDAPAYGKLLRGDKILQINGQAATHQLLEQSSQNLNRMTTFSVLRTDAMGTNSELDVQVIPREYTFKVTLGKIINQDTKKIGYLRYDSFTASSVEEFEREFTNFKNANIDELVIDLRYNGGGSIAVASTLLENITNKFPGKRQVYLDFNDKLKYENEPYSFTDEIEANDLSMTRVYFLVTKGSASASELVISALKPYLGDTNVITIGTNTHGKPVGMGGRQYANNYYFIINFLVRNNSGETTSFEGITPTCEAEDDITHLMGDTDENMLKTALHHIKTGTCL